MINYNMRVFSSVKNTENGEVCGDTVFNYYQKEDIIWAEYSGGEIAKGFLVGRCFDNGSLEFCYNHVNRDKHIRTGKCLSNPEILDDGRIRMYEKWEWTNGDMSKGTSTVEEIK